MQKKFRITVNGTEYDVTVEDMSEGSSYILPQPGDMKIPAPAPTASTAAAPAATSGPNDLPSPLAGVVVSISVVAGQQVSRGQEVAVIEAMKMKTSVVAHKDGAVKDIAVKLKDAVDAGQRLMTLE